MYMNSIHNLYQQYTESISTVYNMSIYCIPCTHAQHVCSEIY